MHFPTTLLALAATLISTAAAEGWYQIRNNCKSNIYYQRVGQEGVDYTGVIWPNTVNYGSYGRDGDGISVKLSFVENDPHPYQFETTVHLASNQVFYDLSAINGDPFYWVPNGVWASDGSGPLAWCPAGNNDCAYRYPTDDSKTHAAHLGAVIMMGIC